MPLILGIDIGVTENGYVTKTLPDIKAEVETAWRAEFGANTDLDPNSPDGQIIGILSDRLAELWELGQAVYKAQDPDAAGGQAQDAVAAITGSVRQEATHATVTLTATGSDGTILTAGREVSDGVTEDRFATLVDATLAPGTLWNSTTVYAVGFTIRTTAVRCYRCITAGTSGGSEPTGTGLDITDGTVHWRYLGEGLAFKDIAAQAVEAGAVTALANTLKTIETPVSGWNNVVNLLDAIPGENEESNDEFRVRRELELAASGAGTLPSIRAGVLRVPNVTSAVAFKNDTSVTDVDGRPPHSVEVVVEGGVNQAIGEAIYANVSAGIQPYGTTTVAVTDSQGLSWNVGFTRPTIISIYVRVDVIKNPLVFPVDGTDQIKAAIAALDLVSPIGKDVIATRVVAAVFTIPGVLDVPIAFIRNAPTPIASTTIPIGPRERADYDTSRVTVLLSDGVP